MMLFNRRQVLKAGATLALSTAAAGCLGDGADDPGESGDSEEADDARDPDDPGDDTHPDDSRDERLAIERLRLVTEQPADFREYDEVDEPVYGPDDVVWFYFEPVGVTTEDAGAGEERIELTASLAIFGPDGNEIASVDEQFHRDVPEGGTDELYLYFHFTPPMTPPRPGEYTAELSVSDELSGEEASDSVSFVIERAEAELSIEHVRFVEDEPAGYREYTALEEPVFGPDEPIWLYYEPTGLTADVRNGEHWVEFRTSATVTGPDGEDVGRVGDELAVQISDEDDLDELFVVFDLELRRPGLGEHTVEIRVHDQVRRGSTTETTTFTYEDEDRELLEVFRAVVEDETGVEIERLHLRNDTVTFEYRSAHAYEDERAAFEDELAYISGAYAGIVDAGLSAEMLRGIGEDAEGAEFSYRVETETAHQWNDGDITEEEFVEQVLNSLRI